MPQPLPVGIEIPYLDKFLHALEYGILSYLLIRALRQTQTRLVKGALIMTAVALATLYAATDEFHQIFVPGRSPDIFDLLADFTGAAITGFIKR
jgi:VanZ family protein